RRRRGRALPRERLGAAAGPARIRGAGRLRAQELRRRSHRRRRVGGRMTSVARLARSRLGELQQIGKGGQGRVYRATELQLPGDARPLVYKEYRSRDISIAGLDRMTSFRERLDRHDRAMLDVLTNWPL